MDNDNGKEENSKLKQTLARVALVLMGLFILGGCICMIFGNTKLMMAALFCLVFIPIILYCFILVYDMTHGKSRRERLEHGLPEKSAEDGEEEGNE